MTHDSLKGLIMRKLFNDDDVDPFALRRRLDGETTWGFKAFLFLMMIIGCVAGAYPLIEKFVADAAYDNAVSRPGTVTSSHHDDEWCAEKADHNWLTVVLKAVVQGLALGGFAFFIPVRDAAKDLQRCIDRASRAETRIAQVSDADDAAGARDLRRRIVARCPEATLFAVLSPLGSHALTVAQMRAVHGGDVSDDGGVLDGAYGAADRCSLEESRTGVIGTLLSAPGAVVARLFLGR